MVQARNITDTVRDDVVVNVAVGRDGKSDALKLSASPNCSVGPADDGGLVSCLLGDLRPGEQRTHCSFFSP